MSGNFTFLAERFPALQKLGTLAENYLYTDPNCCLFKMGVLGETLAIHMLELNGLSLNGCDATQANKVRVLNEAGLLPQEIDDTLHALRMKRNAAVHEGHDSLADCRALLEMSYNLCVWFMQAYGDANYEPAPFVLPINHLELQKRACETIHNQKISKHEIRYLMGDQWVLAISAANMAWM